MNICLENVINLSKIHMSTKRHKSSRMVREALCSGDAFGEKLMLCRFWTCFLCLHRRISIYQLERIMIPITKTSLKMNNVDITYFIGKLKCTREQDSVIYSR